MIVTDQKINQVIGIDKDSTIAMEIDEKSNKKLMMILSQNLYQDPIGSIVREYVSNALDAQREAGNNEPIHVKLIKENRQFVFKVVDNGVGLSPDRVEHVFAKYLSSTKEGDANQLGYYGLGSKSALSYVDSFMVHSRYDGKLYSYMMLKGEEGTELSLLDINETTERNGVTICINLHDDHDYVTFIEKIKNQLCYFEGVFVEDEFDDFDNDFKIVKTDQWKYSEMNQDQYMHLCLDNVYYSLDFRTLGIEPIKMPIGLNFSLKDGIMPVPSRESFLYSPSTKELILERIKQVGIYFINKWNETAPNVNTLEEAVNIKQKYGEIFIHKTEDIVDGTREIRIKIDKKLEKVCGIEMRSVALSLYPNLSVDNLNSNSYHILQDYKVYGRFSINTYKTKFGYKDNKKEFEDMNLHDLSCATYLLEPGEALSKVQIAYLKWCGDSFNIIRKHGTTKLGSYNKYNQYQNYTYRGLLNLHKHPKETWRDLIKEYQSFVKSYTDQFLTISDIMPTQKYLDWKESQKKERKQAKRNTQDEITISTIRYPLKGGTTHKFVVDKSWIVNYEALHDEKGVRIYFHEDKIDEQEGLFEFLKHSKSNAQLISLSDRNFTKIEKELTKKPLHNWIRVEEFWDSRNRRIAKFLCDYMLHTIWDSCLNSKNINKYTEVLDIKANKAYNNLTKKINYFSYTRYNSKDREFIREKLRLYAKNNWLDKSLIQEFKKVFTDINRFDFLDMFNFGYNKDKKLITSFTLTVYLKLVRQEKISGVFSYERYDIQAFIDTILKEPEVPKEEVKEIEGEEELEEVLDEIEPETGDDF